MNCSGAIIVLYSSSSRIGEVVPGVKPRRRDLISICQLTHARGLSKGKRRLGWCASTRRHFGEWWMRGEDGEMCLGERCRLTFGTLVWDYWFLYSPLILSYHFALRQVNRAASIQEAIRELAGQFASSQPALNPYLPRPRRLLITWTSALGGLHHQSLNGPSWLTTLARFAHILGWISVISSFIYTYIKASVSNTFSR